MKQYKRAKATAFISTLDSGDGTPLENIYVANLKSGNISVLTGSGAIIWEILKDPLDAPQIISEIAEIYGVEETIVTESVTSFIESLTTQGLLETSDESH